MEMTSRRWTGGSIQEVNLAELSWFLGTAAPELDVEDLGWIPSKTARRP
jgi:hypothetical protein